MRRITCVLLLCVMLCGCAQMQKTDVTCFAMDTVMDLQIWGKEAQQAAQQIQTMLTQLESQWSVSDPESVLSCLNSGREPEWTEGQKALLKRIEAVSKRTGGAFDPQLYSAMQVWGFYEKFYRVPSEEELLLALSDEKWDLGGVIKGYAGDLAVEILKELDVEYALLNLGGNVQTYGTKSDGGVWKIGIQNPDGGSNIGVLSVTGTCAVVTSGDYQRYFEQDGKTYHHILDPETGCPVDSGLRSVTVICQDGLTADALSTALFVMGLDDATEFWRQSEDFEAVFLLTDGRICATEGAELSGCEFEVIAREK